jgi:hypothetical protein
MLSPEMGPGRAVKFNQQVKYKIGRRTLSSPRAASSRIRFASGNARGELRFESRAGTSICVAWLSRFEVAAARRHPSPEREEIPCWPQENSLLGRVGNLARKALKT